MLIWRIKYYLFHGLDTGVRIELDKGCFSYPEGSLPPYKRQALESLLIDAKVSKALIAVKRENRVAIFGIDDHLIGRKIRNIILT